MLSSEKVVVEAPMSFTGSARRIMRLAREADGWAGLVLLVLLVAAVALVWCLVMAWYLTWGLCLVPYRLIRRRQRRDKVARLRHRELIGR